MEFEIDFADSTILYYTVKDFNISLLLERWNAEIIEMNFLKYVLFEATSHRKVSAFEECFESPLLEKALDYVYEKIPDKHNLRIFRFIDTNENISLEIVCENIHIEKLTS
jgi:hypothetical protein